MNVLLVVVGIGVFVAGLVTVAFGIPVKEFSFGDTLIMSGAVVSCTGLIMVSLSLVVRELRAVADRLRFAAEAADRGGDHRGGDLRVPIPPGRGIEDTHPPLWDADRAAPGAASDPTGTPSVRSPPWQVETFTRDRAAAVPDVAAPEPPESSDAPSPLKPRRNLLFASSMRKERERAMAERSGLAGLSPPAPATHAPDLEGPRPPSFDDPWPRSERSRPEPGRASSVASSARARIERTSGFHGQSASAVTVMRSGVVDGMAYSLYSDGTIEAQLPEGMMRFASIDQLRAHLDQGPDRSSPK
ncbi:hypothetical protein V4R08_02180 [Nitrobacter sp. NHB1]|uniref:hypothetical protein n=1 Tax=Nitrobacter sp. NHB1 TaxID=3119830 RepID=UPI002FFF3523